MSTYEMTVDLVVVEHLGINLYSNIAAVLSEAVANAWDADAKTVHVDLDQAGDTITITDDGIGMTVDDMNKRYLRVGYARRDDDPHTGETTALGRPVMGRKGLGKLSLFSIAETIRIQSAKDGERHGCLLTSQGIREASARNERYYPSPLDDSELTIETGTCITLNNLKGERLGVTAAALRKRLSRRFSILGMQHDFNMFINDEAITTEDRGDLRACEYLWKIGDLEEATSDLPNLKEQNHIEFDCVAGNADWRISGWIGTAHKPSDLNSRDAGNLNGVVLFARGRLFHENILDSISDGRLYTKYITGRINADFLDAEGDVDVATSDRQRVQEDDERIVQLKDHLKRVLDQIKSEWADLRGKQQLDDIIKRTPALSEWLTTLKPSPRRQAETMIRRIGRQHFESDDDCKELIKHSIYAFERMRLRGMSAEFAEAVDDAEKLLRLLADQDSYEASLYLDIVTSRLDAIQGLMRAVDSNALEDALKQYLFEHLWLLDPAWERADGSKRMESRLLKEGVIVKDLTEKERLGRVDICYRTIAGKHVIVELKRAERSVGALALVEQGTKYVDKVRKIATSQGEKYPIVEVVFVLGKPLTEEKDSPDRLRHLMESISPGSRVTYYETLIKTADKAYSEFIEQRDQFATVQKIVDQI